MRLRKEDFVSDSQSRTAKSDALLQVSLQRNKNISCEIATAKNKWHLSQRAMDLYIQIRLPRLFNAVSSVLASTEFVATKVLISTLVSTSTEFVRTNSLVRENSLKPLKKKFKQRKEL